MRRAALNQSDLERTLRATRCVVVFAHVRDWGANGEAIAVPEA